MNKLLRLGLAGILLALLAHAANAEFFPTPEFDKHSIPTSTMPGLDDNVAAVLDIGILLLALSLASYWTLVTRSRRNLLLLTIASLAWFGFYRKGCVCPIGATQNVALGIADPTYVVPLTVIVFFMLPLIFTIFFGRTFCGSVCPLGAMQELTAVKSLTLPRWLDHSLGLVAYIYLGASVIFAATGTGFLICRYDPYISFFRMNGNTDLLIFGSSMLVVGVFVGRPYCRFLCPYGAVLRVLGSFSKYRLSIPPDSCVNCQLCEDVCPYGAIHPPTQPLDEEARSKGRRKLIGVLTLAPVILGGFAWLGSTLAAPLSDWHPHIRLAEQVRAEETNPDERPTDASEAFDVSGETREELYASAVTLRTHFGKLGLYLGAWIGFVIAVKLVYLSVRRRRDDYQADRAGCVSCGRCYWYCPVEKLRLGLIDDISELVPAEQLVASARAISAAQKAGKHQETSA